MADTEVEHMHHDLEELKRDMAVIKHKLELLSEEGKLSSFAKKALKEARATPDSQYIKHVDLKKRLLDV